MVMEPRSDAPLNRAALALAAVMVLSACHSGAKNVPGDAQDHAPFHEIGSDERIRFVGTEPFWGGDVVGERLTYTTPENAKGEAIAVSRFAGRGGLSFSGERKGALLTLAIGPGTCTDGMSDQTYPYTAMLKLGDETRQGCAWTDRQRPSGPEASATESR